MKMHSSALLTSALAVGALALPQGQLEKRQAVTQTVTVTVTVVANPYATPAWTPPRLPQTPELRPTNAPPAWTPPRINDPKTRPTTPAVNPTRSSTLSSTTRLTTSSATSSSSSLASSSGAILPSSSSPGLGAIGVQSSVVGSAISQAPTGAVRPSSTSATTPVPTGAAVGPAHVTGTVQAQLGPINGTAYQNAILYHHNAARANHGAQPLVWDNAVAQTAAQAANTCRFEHYIPPNAGQGQNLFTVSGSFFNVTAGITESWYKGEFQAMRPYFGAANIPDDVFHNVGHLTQVLWKGTTRVGCVSVDCGSRMVVGGAAGSPLNKYTVCNYAPAGNVGGQYAINVGQPVSTTNLGSWTD